MSTSSTDTLLTLLRERRSFALNQLSSEPVDLDAVQLILEGANWAPSHGATEPWRFTVFSGAGRQQLSDAFGTAYQLMTPPERATSAGEQGQRDRAWQAPVWISLGMAPALNERGTLRMPEWEELIAAGCAAHNAHLVAASLGLAAKWTSGAVVTHPHVAQLVGLEAPARLLGFLYVGHPAVAWPQGARRALNDKVRWVTD